MTGRRLGIKAAKDDSTIWAWQGGYIEQGTHSGKPYFRRDGRYDGKFFCIFYHDGFKRWFIGESLPFGARINFCVRSNTDASRPEDARWDQSMIQEIVEKKEEPRQMNDAHFFVDAEFPHNRFSINRPGGKQTALQDGDPEWVLGRKLHVGKWALFDGIEPVDLLQGRVGDCWLIAAVAAMAEFPIEVKKLFVRDGFAKGDGRYVLRLFDHSYRGGSMRDITVDEYIPCKPARWWDNDAQPYFAAANGNELWCLILEKAMAKMFGSYGDLAGGTASAAFRALTGEQKQIMWERKMNFWVLSELVCGSVNQFTFPSSGQEKKAQPDFFKELRACDQKNYLMAASISGRYETQRADGLVESHCYSILQVQDISPVGGPRLRLLQLRNPWGNDKKWTGAWSDNHSIWNVHPAIKSYLRPSYADDGLFWMSWDDFSQIFTTVSVCQKAMREGDAALSHSMASLDFRSIRSNYLPLALISTTRRLQVPRATDVVIQEVDADENAANDKKCAPSKPSSSKGWFFRSKQSGPRVDGVKRKWWAEKFRGFGSACLGFCQERHARGNSLPQVRLLREKSASDKKAGVTPLVPLTSSLFAIGDSVQVWSNSKAHWIDNAVVSNVLALPSHIDGMTLPAGAVHVTWDHGSSKKWILPDQAFQQLRKVSRIKLPAAGPTLLVPVAKPTAHRLTK